MYDGNYFQAIEFSCSGSIWVILLMIFMISGCYSILSSLQSFPVLCLCSPFAMAFLKWKLYPKMNYLYFPAYLKKWWVNHIFLTKILMGKVYANFFFNNLTSHFITPSHSNCFWNTTRDENQKLFQIIITLYIKITLTNYLVF
jgi:hypothetical protein